MGYTRAVISGVSWQTVLKGATGVVTLGKIAILARLLSPEQFGQFSLVSIALGLSEAVTETGINVTILQSKHSIEYFLNTAWVVAICRGLLIGCLMVLLGLGMSSYYSDDSLAILVAVAALIPVIKGLINPAIVDLRKQLQFFADSSFRFSLIVVDAALAIALSLMMPSVTALILAILGTAVFEVVLSFAAFKLRPKFSIVPSRLQEIFRNGKGLTIATALTYLNENLDNLIVGKLLGTYNLGLYHNGYRLSHKPNTELAGAANHGIFPVFSKIGDDSLRLRRAFSRTSILLLSLVILASLPLILAPDFFVLLVLGQQWISVAPAIPWLTAAGIVQAVHVVAYSALITKKWYSLLNVHQLATVLITSTALLVLSVPYGIAGAGIAIFLGRITILPVLLFGVHKSIYR
jgi:lipopolysaccharide exporter